MPAKSMADQITILSNGEDSVCIVFQEPNNVPIQTIATVLREQIPEAEDVIPAYESITLVFAKNVLNDDLLTKLDNLVTQIEQSEATLGRQHIIPVCYDERIAPDLLSVCDALKISKNELIEKHTHSHYRVAMLGFQPGFIYLKGLASDLSLPRKATPELKVAPGSIAIGGAQTGIYALASPGGWWVIGQTPKMIFKPQNKQPMLVNPDDTICFEAISFETFQEYEDAS